jgi:HPt (histidine-containing phosphotransfer) domain-containing protein
MSDFEEEKKAPDLDEVPQEEKSDLNATGEEEKSDNLPLKVIDWDEAIATAGDNEDFLKELITDLLNEARTAEDEIGEAIKENNYTVIMRAAHRIGGTCSYFCCEATLDICHKLKTAGHDGMKGSDTPEDLREKFDQLYIQFQDCLNVLREQIDKNLNNI